VAALKDGDGASRRARWTLRDVRSWTQEILLEEELTMMSFRGNYLAHLSLVAQLLPGDFEEGLLGTGAVWGKRVVPQMRVRKRVLARSC
jgi:hypothetical protein